MKLRFAFALLALSISPLSFAADLPPPPPPPPALCGLGDREVWASNTSSNVYHCEGSPYFRNTVNGAPACERDALARGLRAATNGRCLSQSTEPVPPPPCSGPWRLGQKMEAQACCQFDRIVWMTTRSGVYWYEGEQWYERSVGTYQCESRLRPPARRPY